MLYPKALPLQNTRYLHSPCRVGGNLEGPGCADGNVRSPDPQKPKAEHVIPKQKVTARLVVGESSLQSVLLHQRDKEREPMLMHSEIMLFQKQFMIDFIAKLCNVMSKSKT